MRRDFPSSAIVAAAIYLALALLLGFTAHMPDNIWEKALRPVLSPGFLAGNGLMNLVAGTAKLEPSLRYVSLLFLLSSALDIALYTAIVLLVRRIARTVQRSNV
jgi:hypothetical protein